MIDRADVVVVVIEAPEGLTSEDKKIAVRVLEAGRGLLIAANKWDLVEDKQKLLEKQGKSVYGVDMRIVDAEGKVLPWDGKCSGDLEVRGHWVISSYDAVASAFRDWERFSSARTDPDRSAIAFTNSKVPVCLPEESDPPEWYGYRRSLSRILSPQASERLRARARFWTAHSLDQVVERGECDFVHDLTCPVPAAVTLEWMGFPREEWQMFSDAFHGVSAYPAGSPEHHRVLDRQRHRRRRHHQ